MIGHTCPACPKHDEPIRRTVNGAGIRFRVTLDIGADKSGKRRQETRVFATLAESRAHVDSRGAEVRKARRGGAVGHTLAVHLSTYLFATTDGGTAAGARLGEVFGRAAKSAATA